MFSQRTMPTLTRKDLGILVVVVALILGIGFALLPRIQHYFLVRSGEQGKVTLELSVAGLRGALRRFEPMPALIGERVSLMRVLRNPGNADLVRYVNEDLRQTAERLEASDVYLMDASGLTIAASSYQKQLSFVGRNFAFRPYFTEAMEGRLGRYFALGTTSGERGYFYAAPIRDREEILGVLAVKFTVDEFEEAWRAGNHDLVVTDMNGVIFMSNRPEWHFRSFSQLSPEILAEIRRTQQYPLDRIDEVPKTQEPLEGDLSLMRIGDGSDVEEFTASSVLLEDVGWRVWTLVPTGEARAQALAVFFGFAVLALLLALVMAVIMQRRARLRDRFEVQRATQELLERRVEERTADLNEANRLLIAEVEERRAAENQLRKTQTELIQAGKLAALGQMSAALSHEINQPLAAIKAYAENAGAFLDRDRAEDARQNVRRISEMADRVAAISGHLRNFARRPQEGVGPVEIASVIEDALGLMEVRLKASGAALRYEPSREPLWVLGGRLRLQQVVVNLLNNALDAMAATKDPVLGISVTTGADGKLRLSVTDNGEGLSPDVLNHIFDPFFTTKSPGKGLGLGLSISYNIIRDFGGRLVARNADAGGAELTVELRMTEPPAGAAVAPAAE